MVHGTINKIGTNILKLAWEYWFLLLLYARKASMTISKKIPTCKRFAACALKENCQSLMEKFRLFIVRKGNFCKLGPRMLRQVIRKQNFKKTLSKLMNSTALSYVQIWVVVDGCEIDKAAHADATTPTALCGNCEQ